jgi:hypothetical protein
MRHVRPSVRLSASISAAPAGRFSVKCYIGDVYENLLRKSKFGYNREIISVSLHGDVSNIYSCWRHKIAIKSLSSSEMVSGC